MYGFFLKNRLQTMASIVTSLLLASGCRNASVQSSTGIGSDSSDSGNRQFYRSFERSTPRPQYDSDGYQLPSDGPGTIPPMPPNEPAPTPIPPSPSVQKSRRNLLPTGLNLPAKLKKPVGTKPAAVAHASRFDDQQNREAAPAFESLHANEEVIHARPSASTSGMETPQQSERIMEAPVITPAPRAIRYRPASSPRLDAPHSSRTESETEMAVPPATLNTVAEPPMLLPPDA